MKLAIHFIVITDSVLYDNHLETLENGVAVA